MSEIIKNYFFVLAHPFKVFNEAFRELHDVRILSLTESLATAWVFYLLHAMLKVVFVTVVGHQLLASYEQSLLPDLTFMAPEQINSMNFVTYLAIIQSIFFPLSAFVSLKIWSWVISTFEKLAFNRQTNSGETIMKAALSAHLFEIIPLVGGFVSTLMRYFIIFGGLRQQLQASTSLALVIMIAPSLVATMLFTLPFLSLMLFV